MGPFAEKDDDEADGRPGPYGKPVMGRDGPYGKGRVLYGSLHREGRRRGYGEVGPYREEP